jgi:hypothetical protein
MGVAVLGVGVFVALGLVALERDGDVLPLVGAFDVTAVVVEGLAVVVGPLLEVDVQVGIAVVFIAAVLGRHLDVVGSPVIVLGLGLGAQVAQAQVGVVAPAVRCGG